jgi:hypothetical protein
MGFEWQFGTESRAGEETRACWIGSVEIVDDDASACTSAYGKLFESVTTGSEHTDGSACESTSAKGDWGKRYEESK